MSRPRDLEDGKEPFFFLFVTICPQSSGFLSEDLHFLPAIHWTDAVYPQGCGLGLAGLYGTTTLEQATWWGQLSVCMLMSIEF